MQIHTQGKNKYSVLVLTHLSLVVFILLAVMEDSITFPAQVAADIAQDQSLCLSIIVVVTQRLVKIYTLSFSQALQLKATHTLDLGFPS